jgi:hypothetical protein
MLKLIMKGLIGGLVQLALFGLALVIPAGLVSGGTWYWRRGLSAPASKKQPVADRVATGLLVLSTLACSYLSPSTCFI